MDIRKVATAHRPVQNTAHHGNVKCQMNFTYFFTARSSGLVTVTSPRLWKGEFYIFWIGLDYENKTKLFEARLSIRSINNLDDFFPVLCILTCDGICLARWRDFKPHRTEWRYAYKSGSGFKRCRCHIYGNLCHPPTHKLTALFGHS